MFVKATSLLVYVDEIRVIEYIHSHMLELDSIRSHDIFLSSIFYTKLGITPEFIFGFQFNFC